MLVKRKNVYMLVSNQGTVNILSLNGIANNMWQTSHHVYLNNESFWSPILFLFLMSWHNVGLLLQVILSNLDQEVSKLIQFLFHMMFYYQRITLMQTSSLQQIPCFGLFCYFSESFQISVHTNKHLESH